MRIEVTGTDKSIVFTVNYSWTPGDDPWTASPTGIMGANKGHWVRQGGSGGGYSILFYGKGVMDQILLFDSVTIHAHGNPFRKGQAGYGLNMSSRGAMPYLGTIDWKVLSI